MSETAMNADDHATRMLVVTDGPCSFLTRPITQIKKTEQIVGSMCGRPAAYRALGKLSWQEARLCVEHTAHARACPVCAPLITRLHSVTA